MEIWESSGQWMFSVYSMLREKKNISGFADFSPEELRLEYYACQAEGNPLKYINAVQQLGSKWKQRILELKNLNPSSKMALFNELSSPSSDMTSGYNGQQKPAFGSSSFPTNNTAPTAATFSFKADAANAAKAGATNSLAGSNVPAFGNKPTSAPSFGSGGAATAASFSFAPSSSSNFGATTSTSGFGNASNTASFQGTANSAAAPAFGVASSSTAATGFGGGFSTTGAMNTGVRDLFSAGTVGPGPVTSLFVQTTGPLHATASSTSLDGQSFRPSALNTTNSLFTPQNELSAEELAQFKAQRFTLGKIPLKPPPADLLNVS
ncbi:hypothetical protein XENTR_v10016125 [Xenopus tropicalis]|nr:hypothetical protein XENTR_v10016125 [Xenopus tropicalis]